jgi:hypothetical protein
MQAARFPGKPGVGRRAKAGSVRAGGGFPDQPSPRLRLAGKLGMTNGMPMSVGLVRTGGTPVQRGELITDSGAMYMARPCCMTFNR